MDTDTIGGRIWKRREIRGRTITELASETGVTVETLRHWERDRSAPRGRRLQRLASVLDVSPVWLMTGIEAEPMASPVRDAEEALEELHAQRERLDRKIAELEIVAALEPSDEAAQIVPTASRSGPVDRGGQAAG